MNSRELEPFDLTTEPQGVREQYGSDHFGQGCLLARRLVENDFHFVEVVSPGWDTHFQNFPKLRKLTATLDRSLSTLVDDLHDRGMWDSTLIVVATEFGRTPKINPVNAGRNHHVNAFSCLLAGGPARGGLIYGKTDRCGHEVTEDPVTIPELNATIAHGLGIPTDVAVKLPDREIPISPAANAAPISALVQG
jgi:hypothetical protein